VNPAHLAVLSFSIFGIVSSALAQDVRAQVWIHEMVDLHEHEYAKQYLFDAGYQADTAHDYDAALYNLSSFSKVNDDRLQAATSDDEKQFRDWLKSRLKDLDRICNRKSPQNGSVSKRPSVSATGQKYPPTPANGDLTQGPSVNHANQESAQRPIDGDLTQGPSVNPANQEFAQRPTDGDSTQGPRVDPANRGNSQAPTAGLNPQEPSGSPTAQGISQYVTNGVTMGGMSSFNLQSQVNSTHNSSELKEYVFPNGDFATFGDFGNLWSRFNNPPVQINPSHLIPLLNDADRKSGFQNAPVQTNPLHLWVGYNNPAANDANRKSGAQNPPVQVHPSPVSVHITQSHAAVRTTPSASVHTIQSHAAVHTTQSPSVHTVQSHAAVHTTQSPSVHTAQSRAPVQTTPSASVHPTQSHNPVYITPPHRPTPHKQ
jgi:hypothetical protein